MRHWTEYKYFIFVLGLGPSYKVVVQRSDFSAQGWIRTRACLTRKFRCASETS